jgi:hypothetical protein
VGSVLRHNGTTFLRHIFLSKIVFLSREAFASPSSFVCDRQGISGLVVEYIVAIDVTRVRFPADASCVFAQRATASKPSSMIKNRG